MLLNEDKLHKYLQWRQRPSYDTFVDDLVAQLSSIEPYYFCMNFEQILALFKSLARGNCDAVVPSLKLIWLCISNINTTGQDLLDQLLEVYDGILDKLDEPALLSEYEKLWRLVPNALASKMIKEELQYRIITKVQNPDTRFELTT